MKNIKDLRLKYKIETGLEPVVTAYGFRPYLTWLEGKLLQLIEPQEQRIPDAGKTITTHAHPDLDQARDDYYNNRNKLLERQ